MEALTTKAVSSKEANDRGRKGIVMKGEERKRKGGEGGVKERGRKRKGRE
jgi:hypothetical protein